MSRAVERALLASSEVVISPTEVSTTDLALLPTGGLRHASELVALIAYLERLGRNESAWRTRSADEGRTEVAVHE